MIRLKNKQQLLFFVISILTSFSFNVQANVELSLNDAMAHYLTQQNKYIQPEGTMEKISFNSKANVEGEDMILRHGFLLKRKDAKAVVIVCNGYMCNKFDSSFLRTLLFPNYHVLTFDFRAHGDAIDENQCCTFGRDEAYDVIAAVNYIKSRPELKDLPRIAYGFSMGAVAAIQAQSANPDLFDLMVLDCPYDHSRNVIKKGLESLTFSLFGYNFNLPGRTFLERYAFHPYVQTFLKTLLKTVANMDATATNTYIYPVSPVNSVKKITVPCFFIHCAQDEKVPAQAAKNLFDNASGYKRLWITAGRRHFDSFFYHPEKYVYKVMRFIENVVSGNYIHKPQQKIKKDDYARII